MATVDKELADKLVAQNGHYADDDRVMRIVKYTNFAGAEAFGIEYAWEIGRYAPSPYVNKPEIYWEAK